MARSVKVTLTADVSPYIAGMSRAATATKDFAGHIDNAAKQGKLGAVADQATKFGIAGVAAFGLVVKSAADFDKEMSAAGAATSATSAQMGQLRAAALQAGKDTKYSATEAANGITELGKAGVSTADILHGGLKGALSLAAAGQLSVGDAAETAASAMTQFHLSGSAVPHIADLLAQAANKAQGSVGDLGYALKMGGLVASQTGHSIEETTGVLAAFASAGLIGSDAGTSLKEMLLKLMSPAEATQKVMGNLGIEVYDAQGNMKSFAGIADELRKSMAGLTQQQRDADMSKIFGSDAIRAATILYREGSAGVQDWTKKVNIFGAAATTSAKLTDNFAGDVERLKGSIETLAITSGSGANGGLRVLTKGVNALVNQFLGLPGAVGSTVTVVAGLSGATALGLVGFVKLRKGTADAIKELTAMGPVGEKTATGLGKVTSAAGKVAAAFIALQVAGAIIGHFQKDLNPQIDALAVGLDDFAQSGQLTGEAARTLGGNLGDLKVGFKFLADGDNSRRAAMKNLQQGLESIAPGLAGTNTSLAKTAERITAVDQTLAQLVGNGQIGQAQSDFAALAKVLAVNGVSIDEFKKQFPEYAAALEVASKQSGVAVGQFSAVEGPLVGVAVNAAAAGGATKKLGGDVKGAGRQAAMTADEIKKLSDAIDVAINGALSMDRAAIAFKQGAADLRKELTTGTRTLSVNSAEGRKNRGAVLDQIAAIEDLRKSRVAEGVTLDEAGRKYLRDIDGLRKSMLQAGFTKKQVDGLIRSYKDIPGLVNSNVHATGIPGVKRSLQGLLVMQEALKKGIPISAAQGAFNKQNQTGSGLPGRSAGGWTGPGSTYQPAGIVHADEFVIRKDSRQKIESRAPGLLDRMNTTGAVPGYAGGGQVWPFPTTAAMTRVPSKAEALAAVTPAMGPWPSSPSAQRGDSGVWRSVVALIKSTGPMSGHFGNAYRAGDPLWHGSGRAVDWMGYNQDGLATFLAARRPLELIHRTAKRDYAYTRGVDKGSFNNSLMEAHRNHVHIAMAAGGIINEPVVGVGASGRSYSFAENGPETVTPGVHQFASAGSGGGSTTVLNVHFSGPVGSRYELRQWLVGEVDELRQRGRI